SQGLPQLRRMKLRKLLSWEKSGPGAMLMPAARACLKSLSESTCLGSSHQRRKPPLGRVRLMPEGKLSTTASHAGDLILEGAANGAEVTIVAAVLEEFSDCERGKKRAAQGGDVFERKHA